MGPEDHSVSYSLCPCRCHQYNELLASEEGHRKLKRVLKAWVVDNPGLVYWQGLDSLAAPFLYLNFNNEALAWACLSAFIPKYLYNMFQKDNAAVIQEYLAKFSHLQAFHDPVLFNHLDEIGFIPDLYAIPWVLTMFSHVFPLGKIFHLWDRLLLGDSSFPLCVGLAVLLQLRPALMEAQFNECILLFSEMPSVDIDHVVTQSMDLFAATPPSISFRAEDYHRRSGGSSESQNGGGAELDIQLLSVQVLKAEKVGRISARDVMNLLAADGGGQSRVQVVDVRPREEVRLGTLPAAVNVPAQVLVQAGPAQLQDSFPFLEEARQKQRVIAVVGRAEDGGQAARAAEALLRANYPRVATVHGGIEAFRGADILALPDSS
jgi:TBC domain-containing protein kinase-like protein